MKQKIDEATIKCKSDLLKCPDDIPKDSPIGSYMFVVTDTAEHKRCLSVISIVHNNIEMVEISATNIKTSIHHHWEVFPTIEEVIQIKNILFECDEMVSYHINPEKQTILIFKNRQNKFGFGEDFSLIEELSKMSEKK